MHVPAQAAKSWSATACCDVKENWCVDEGLLPNGFCGDHTAASDFIFRLQPGEPQRYLPTGTGVEKNLYQHNQPDGWPAWGNGDLSMGCIGGSAEGPGNWGMCHQGDTYTGRDNDACGGSTGYGDPCSGLGCWGPTDMEVWFPVRDQI